MENKLLKSRENMYRFLSRLYLLEVDEPLLTALKNMEFPKESPMEDLTEGYEMIEAYLTKRPKKGGSIEEASDRSVREILDELAVDYARIFLSAGVAQGKAAFPYESVYTSKNHLMKQEASSEVSVLFAARGLKPGADAYRVPEDHLGLLMEYMAVLCKEAAEASGEEKQAIVKEQAEFLKKHLLNWTPVFVQETIKYAGTAFYQGLAKLTRGFLNLESSLLAG